MKKILYRIQIAVYLWIDWSLIICTSLYKMHDNKINIQNKNRHVDSSDSKFLKSEFWYITYWSKAIFFMRKIKLDDPKRFKTSNFIKKQKDKIFGPFNFQITLKIFYIYHYNIIGEFFFSEVYNTAPFPRRRKIGILKKA